MAVIPFPMDLSPQGPSPRMSWELRSLTARNVSPLSGVATTYERPGAHWAAQLPYENLAEARQARQQTLAASLRGHANRTYVPVFGWTRRGSFPATELLTNHNFASGTTGWSASGARVVTASDGLLRITREAHHSTADLVNANSAAAIAVTQYAPYAARCIDHQGRSSLWSSGPQLGSSAGGEEYGRGNSASFGLKTLVTVIPATTAHFGLVDYDTGANVAGDYIQYSYTSLARCALVDNAPNHLLRSDEINTTWSQVGLDALGTNTATAPDGSATAEIMQENSSNSTHGVNQSAARTSVATDLCAFGYFRQSVGDRDIRLTAGNDGTNFGHAIFDLGAGTVGSASNAGTATNARAFIVDAGGGWYFCSVVARLPAAATIEAYAQMVSAGTTNYTGDGASSVAMWRLGCTVSGVPTRGGQTTSAALQSGTLQSGSGLHLKGLPVSTSGLLLQGDPVEIITGTTSQLVRVRGSLNSDAAGLGYMQFEPPLRVSPSDNAAVIIQNPLCKMMADSNNVGWTDRAAGFSDLELSFVEDTYP